MSENKGRISVFDNTVLNDTRKKNTKRRKRATLIYAGVFIVLIFAAISLIAAVFCRFTALELTGGGIYTEAEILAAAELEYGTQLFSINTKEAQKRIMTGLSGIEDVKVSFSLPNKLIINISQGVPAYYFESNGTLYYLTEKFIALGSEIAVGEQDEIIRIGNEQIKRYSIGERVELYDDDWYYLIAGLTSSVKLAGINERLSLIETRDKFDIVIRYDGRIRICIGEYENVDEKLEFAKSTIESLAEDAKGTVRVKNHKVGSFLKDEY